ncbi:MAG: hypothetical protein V7603_6811 [Micromonosporaceae bacterium]
MNLAFLRPLYARPGPFASVYLDATQDTEDGARLRELRWRAADERLAAAGADQATREALGAAVATHTGTGQHGLALFAGGGDVLAQVSLPDPPPVPVAAWSPRPVVAPLVADLGERVRWLRAVVDRTGADLVLSTGHERVRQVEGAEHYPVHKAKPGGWSAPRYQRSAETTWDRNAKDIAEAVADAATAECVDVIVLAGDVRERQLVHEHLPAVLSGRVVTTGAGSRAPGADPEPLDEATAAAVREREASRRAEVLDRYRAGRAHGLAVAGPDEVRRALEWGQVDTLLVDREVPVPDEFVRLAVQTDAEVTTVGADQERLPGGVGTVLRYPLGAA